MQPDTKRAVEDAITRARMGEPTMLPVFSRSLRKDVDAMTKRALRRTPGAWKLVRAIEVGAPKVAGMPVLR